MKIGQTCTITGTARPHKEGKKRTWVRKGCEPVQAVYLGTTTKQEGTVIESANWEEPSYLKVAKVIKLSVFQPVKKTSTRYRKPVFVFSEDIAQEEEIKNAEEA